MNIASPGSIIGYNPIIHICASTELFGKIPVVKKPETKIYEVTDPTRRPIDADLQVPDCRKFKQRTGWEAQIPFEKTTHDLLDYWQECVEKERSSRLGKYNEVKR